jgi:hypothetical protein
MASADPPQWAIDAYALFWNKPGTVVTDTSVLAHRLDRTLPIFVRNEYYKIWKYIVSQKSRQDEQKGGLVVWGQPGIGA